jgi:hypothetical protein
MKGLDIPIQISLLILIACSTVLGCNANSPGSISLSLSWEETPTENVWVWLRVEHRTDELLPGPILSSTGPHLFQPGEPLAMKMPEVPVGSNRVLVAEVRDGENSGLPIRRYGISPRFTLENGTDEALEVSVLVHRPEAEYHAPEMTLLFHGTERPRAKPEDMIQATLRVRSSGANSLVVANDASFIANQTAILLKTGGNVICEEEPDEDAAWNVCEIDGWNIKADVEEQGDVIYPVYVRLVDRFGYESKAYITSVSQDSVGPTVLSASLTLEAPAGAGLETVSAIAEGTAVGLVFTVSEPLVEAPAVNAVLGEHVLSFGAPTSTSGEGGNTYAYSLIANALSSAPSAQGEYAVRVHLEDLAGNVGDEDLDLAQPFLVDSIPPAELVPEKQQLVHLFRAPWGAGTSGGVPLAELRSCPSPAGHDWPGCPKTGKAFGPASTITVYGADLVGGVPVCSGTVLGTGETDGMGSLAIAVDHQQVAVCVAERDASGKTSVPFPVTHIQWVASMGGKAGGSDAENPNLFENRAWFGPELWPLDAPGVAEPPSTDSLASPGGIPIVTHGASRWYNCSGGIENREVWKFDMAFDAARNRLVRFGGLSRLEGSSSTAKESSRTWEWNGYGWFELAQSGPDPRHGHSMSYDLVRGATILFGGSSDGSKQGDTWSWDGSNWQQHFTAGPEPRAFQSQAYDSQRGQTILFGGLSGEPLGDTWLWDGSQWSELIPDDPEGDGNPPPRVQSSLAVDIDRGVAVLYGGCADNSCSQLLSDTWEFNGFSWREIKVAGPGARAGHSMAFDEQSKTTVLFGGTDGSVKGDAWRYDGHTWNQVGSSGPSPRKWHQLAWDIHRQAVVLYGGTESGFETWELAGSHWEIVDAAWLPDYTGGHLLDYDPVGKSSLHLEAAVDDAWHFAIWSWSGRGWKPVANVGDHSPFVGGPISDGDGDAAWDPVRQRLVYFGGGNKQAIPQDHTWEWDGSKWAEITPIDPEGDGNPGPRVGHQLVYAPDRGTVMLFGGTDDYEAQSFLSDTWEWDGSSWALVYPGGAGGPNDRVDMAIAYDSERSALQVVGGTLETWNCEPHMWELIDGEWEETVSGLAGRDKHQLVYDPVVGKSVMWGGQSCSGPDCAEGDADYCGYLWQFDGQEWTLLAADGPAGRTRFGMSFDQHRERLVLFGGAGNVSFGPTWEWDRGRQARPGQVMVANLATAAPGSSPTIMEIAVTWEAGATSYPEGNAVDGAELHLWRNGSWSKVSSNESSIDVPSALSYSLTDPLAAAVVPVGKLRGVAVAVTPLATNGILPEAGQVASNYAEVRVAFRFPQPTEIYCDDGLDDDHDGSIDCKDDDCWCTSECGLHETGCCFGTTQVSCEGAQAVAVACGEEGGDETCGWLVDTNSYGCGGIDGDPTGEAPLSCPGGCLPDCHNKECGSNGCGGSCGFCAQGNDCVDGLCFVCEPDCANKECGGDGCGGSCGTCQDGAKCMGAICVQGPCFGITYEGCCDGEVLTYCDSGVVQHQDCGDGMALCGWSQSSDYYDCETDGQPDPTGLHPIDCPQYE